MTDLGDKASGKLAVATDTKSTTPASSNRAARSGRDPRWFAALVVAAVLAPLGGLGASWSARAAALTSRRSSRTPRADSASRTVTISPVRAQRMDGFGASGDWWPIDLHHFPAAAQKSVASLLFSSKGIMLSRYRYNIGGGGVGVTQPTAGESELGPKSRAPQSMYVSAGDYDWSHDPGGTAFLKYAARYHVPDIEANVNSAPWTFTSNHRSCGGQLRSSAIPAYVRYLVRVVRHAHQAWHATLSFVSPMNEPDLSRSDCTQEGMKVPPHERGRLVRALGTAFRRSAPYAHVIADESSSLGTQFIPEAPQWLSVAGVSRSLAALATHTYDFPSNGTLANAAELARRHRKQLWMTEICCMVGREGHPVRGVGYDPTMRGALTMANLIWQDLTYGRMSTWDWWGAAAASIGCDPVTSPGCTRGSNPSGFNSGLLYYDPNYLSNHDYVIYTTKRFWTMGNFSRFIRPGAIRHPVSRSPAGTHLLAFATARGWRVIAINERRSNSAHLSFRFPRRAAPQPAGAYRTGAKLSLARVAGARRGRHRTFTAQLPAQTVTTFLFK